MPETAPDRACEMLKRFLKDYRPGALDDFRTGADPARMREPQSDGTRKRGGRSLRGLPPVEACATARRSAR